VLLAADVRARYYSRAGFAALWRQYLQYGYWKVRVMQKHPLQMRWRQFVPATFVAALILAAGLVPVVGAWPLTLLAAAYLAAVVAASLAVARRAGWHLLAGLPVAFGALHLAYGLGFLAGGVRFVTRWFERPVETAPLVLGKARRS
jgi:hypothetical protein